MATPFVALGLKATDKLVEDHLHKLPDKYFHTSTYNPKKVVNSVRSRKGSKQSDSGSQDRGVEEDEERENIPEVEEPEELPRMTAYKGPPPPGTGDIYSHEPPKMRSQYIPPAALAAGAGASYFPPPPTEPYDYGYGRRDSTSDYDRRGSRNDYDKRDSRSDYERRGGRRYEDDYDDDESYYSAPRRSSRPKAVSRRSNSHPGYRSKKYYDDDDNDDDSNVRKYDSGSQHVDRAMERAHRYGVKDEIKNSFTDSKGGLAGSAVGAIVGGWAASKAQVAYDKKGKGEANPLLTLLGAAVGGLAVNAVVEKFEEEKGETIDQQIKWDKMFGKRDGSEKGSDRDGKSERGGDRDRGSDRGGDRDSRRKRRSTRQDKGYDSGYD